MDRNVVFLRCANRTRSYQMAALFYHILPRAQRELIELWLDF